MKPLYIFDLDGTLALNEHRQYLVQGETKNWGAFFAACVNDEPNVPVIDTMHALVEAGEYGDAHVLAWVIDCGNQRIECGLAGRSALPGAEGHLLFGLAQHKLERDTLGN